MPETTTTTTEPDATTTDDAPPDFQPITLDSQAAVDSFVGNAKKQARASEAKKYADYESLKAKAAELDSIRQASMSQTEKDAERIRDLTTQLAAKDQAIADAQRAGLRAEVAAAKGVPVDSIHGETREELEARADELLEWRGNQPPPRKTPGVMPAGGSGAGKTTTAQDKKERAAAMLREFYGGRH